MAYEISLGKIRGLQQCSTEKGVIAMLALDHRQNLRKSLNPADPSSVPDQALVDFKREVVTHLAGSSSAVLLDPLYSGAQALAQGYLPGQVGLVLALEETGYSGNGQARSTDLLPGWDVSKAKRMGASAIKLLVYYHPQAPTSLAIRDLVADIAGQCRKADLAFFLEPLTYSIIAEKMSPAERREAVVRTAADLSPLGADIMKVEFPLDVTEETQETQWLQACRELHDACVLPWVLLSASVDFEIFLRQVEVACTAGASGVAVGRAVWKEAVALSGEQREEFLRGTARARMQRIRALCDQAGSPWMGRFTPATIQPDWYLTYDA